MTIRPGTRGDLAELVRMACRFIAESPYRGKVTPNPQHQVAVIDHLLEHGAIFVAEFGVELGGFIAMAATPSIVCGELVAAEVAWWVEPEWRRTSAGGRLWLRAEQWAEAIAATFIQMIAPAGDEALPRMYLARGYEPLEGIWQKRVGA